VVWDQILSWENFTELQSHLQAAPVHIRTWWEEVVSRVSNSKRRRLNGVIIYTFWNIWKERNWRIFNNATETVLQVATRIKEDIEERKRAFAYA
jgi:PAS domain-containing protein